MQTDATGSHSPVADGNPLHSALSSLVYSDFMDRQIQNHVMAGNPLPPAFGEGMISFSRGQTSSNRVGEEFWCSQAAGKYVEGISTHSASLTSPQLARASPNPFESPKSVVNSMFEAANCGYGALLPFDASTRCDFSRAASDHEVQESAILNEWMWAEQERLRLETINPGPSRFSKDLCLSLATSSHPRVVVHGATSIQEQGGSELSSSGVTSYSLHRRHIVGSDNTSSSSSNLSLDFSASKPSGSRFFQAMQEILAEFACYALENHDHRTSLPSNCGAELESNHRFASQSNLSCGKELESKKKHLLSLLQVV